MLVAPPAKDLHALMTSDLSQLGLLLLVSALVAMLTRRLRMPYTVGLVLAGMGLYFLHIYIKWHLSKDLIFSVFLPPWQGKQSLTRTGRILVSKKVSDESSALARPARASIAKRGKADSRFIASTPEAGWHRSVLMANNTGAAATSHV